MLKFLNKLRLSVVDYRVACPLLNLSILIVLGLSASVSWADNGLPALKTQEKKRSLESLTHSNLSQFQERLVAPLVTLVREKKIALQTSDQLTFTWRMSAEWDKATEENQNKFEVGVDGRILGVPYSFGQPFARELVDSSALESSLRARMILWNAQALQSALGLFCYQGNLLTLGASNLQYRSVIRHCRLIGQNDQGLEQDDLFLRDLLVFLAPSSMSGFSVITQRFAASKLDAVKIYSTVLGRIREVNEENRSDPLIGDLISIDDLLLMSVNLRSLHVKLLEDKELYVPFISGGPLGLRESIVPRESVVGLSPAINGEAIAGAVATQVVMPEDGASGAVAFGFESDGSGQSLPWLPQNAVFIPRKVWVIEAQPAEPYYSTGKQVFFIDQETWLPMMKLVYAKDGQYKGLFMAIWSLARDKLGKKSIPICGAIVAIDKDGRRSQILQTTELLAQIRGQGLNLPKLFQVKVPQEQKQNNQGNDASSLEKDNSNREEPPTTESAPVD